MGREGEEMEGGRDRGEWERRNREVGENGRVLKSTEWMNEMRRVLTVE